MVYGVLPRMTRAANFIENEFPLRLAACYDARSIDLLRLGKGLICLGLIRVRCSMSERGIIFLVVAALLAVAFFFPYESSDDEYYRTHGKKPLVQKGQSETDGPRRSEGKGIGDPRLVYEEAPRDAKPAAEPGEPGARAADDHDPIVPDFTPLGDQISIAKEQINRHRGGFIEGKRLEGKYLQMTADSTTLPSIAVGSAAYIIFHQDGMFTEHSALSFPSSDGSSSRTPDDLSGHYVLKGYVFTIDQLTPSVGAEPHHDFSICPLGGENEQGMPGRLYIDGKVFRYQTN
jgi:hypothetical protein